MRVERDWVRGAEICDRRCWALLREVWAASGGGMPGRSFGCGKDDRVSVVDGGCTEIWTPTHADNEAVVMNGAPS